MSQYHTIPFPKRMLLLEVMVNLPKQEREKLIAAAELKKTIRRCKSSSLLEVVLFK
jgi:hypothetical protein